MKSADIAEVAAGVLSQYALDLDDVEIKPAGRYTLLRIVVDGDGPDGTGPALDDISEATKDLSAALDSSAATGSQSYTLEVSSRGTDRPLTLPRHWRRNAGRLVRVTRTGAEPVTGRIIRADESTATVDVDAGDRRILQFGEVTDARIQVEMGRKPQPQSQEEPDDGPEYSASSGQSERER